MALPREQAFQAKTEPLDLKLLFDAEELIDEDVEVLVVKYISLLLMK